MWGSDQFRQGPTTIEQLSAEMSVKLPAWPSIQPETTMPSLLVSDI